MISKLKKLKGRGIAELADRGRQKAAAIAERAGAAPDLKMPSDETFFSLFSGGNVTASVQLSDRYRACKNTFYPAFDNKEQTVTAFKSQFPHDEESIVQQADRVCDGRFDLLGYRGLDFGSPIPDWHLEPVSGKRAPMRHWSRIAETDSTETGDKKVIWELNRHQYFTLLGRAYWLTGDEKYANVFAAHVDDWIEKNPPKMGVNWVSSLEIAYRSISWIWALHFFNGSSALTPDLFVKILKCLYLNGRHLERHLSTYSSPNTHLTGEALGLLVIGSFLKEIDEAARWMEIGHEILIKALEFQIREDGGYVEQATQYHRYTADIYLSLLILRKAEGLPVSDLHKSKLRAMLHFLLHVMQPNGETPLIGDDDGGRLHFLDGRSYADFRSTLATGAALLVDAELKFAAGDASPELLWLIGPAGLEVFDSIEPIKPTENIKAFGQSGFYSIRDSWSDDANFVLIDCGEHGFLNGGHAHADALSFVMSVKGTHVFVDSGTYAYTADIKSRDYFRSTAAHNCLTANGQSSSVPDGPFSWKTTATSKVLEWRIDERNILFRGTHGGYERFGVNYEREFRFEPGYGMTLIDKIATSTENEFEICFILSPLVEAEISGGSSVILRVKDGKRELLTIDTKLIEDREYGFDGWRVEPASISPRYGALVNTTKLLFSVKRSRSFVVLNLFKFGGSSK